MISPPLAGRRKKHIRARTAGGKEGKKTHGPLDAARGEPLFVRTATRARGSDAGKNKSRPSANDPPHTLPQCEQARLLLQHLFSPLPPNRVRHSATLANRLKKGGGEKARRRRI